MVITGKGRERETEKEADKLMMAMGTERSKPLHNFALPCLKWGNQRFLRCMKANPNGEVSAAPAASDRCEMESYKKSPWPAAACGGRLEWEKSEARSDGDDGIEAVRAKLMFDLQTAADKMEFAILGGGWKETPVPAAAPAEAESARPWNLRARRAACKAPNGKNAAIGGSGGGGGTVCGGGAKTLNIDGRKPNLSPLRNESNSPSVEKRGRARFSVSLSRREIEDDFMAMAGHRPHRRPKKRPKTLQKQLDSLFPGLWLTEVTADDYRVTDAP